ncbi:hypothetical protein [uncultured Pseudoalteromonas sp.]|uniref:hypothetical protein n=1 Tax=uncultured Pseudoalteromonas sp. TaxID=114053 RepID=UPI002592FCFD|nr:hypothetical protein [uncultured Pseudoalteromonas sp.]
MNGINEDILMLAITEYLKEKDLSAYDAMLENSQLVSNAETWSAVLLRLMSFENDAFKRNEILDADPIKNITLFKNRWQSYTTEPSKSHSLAVCFVKSGYARTQHLIPMIGI